MKNIFYLILLTCNVYSQVFVTPTSSILCNSNYSTANFTISSGSPPYSFTVQTPPCTTTFTSSTASSNPSFTLNCAGVYTFTVKDAGSVLLGSVTHTVSVNTVFNTFIYSVTDTICSGSSVLLTFTTSTSGYTINPFNWSTGATITPIVVSPTSTTVFSLTGLFTSVTSKTCNAVGSKTIVVKPCAGITEIENKINITIYPNPVSYTIFILTKQSEFENSEIEISNTLGQTVLKLPFKNEIDVSKLSQGFYNLKIITQNKQIYNSKFVKE